MPEARKTVRLPLVGLLEICQRAGVKRPVVTVWRKRHEDFPEPVAQLHVGPVFSWPEVMEWLVRTGREWDANWTLDQVRASEQTYPR